VGENQGKDRLQQQQQQQACQECATTAGAHAVEARVSFNVLIIEKEVEWPYFMMYVMDRGGKRKICMGLGDLAQWNGGKRAVDLFKERQEKLTGHERFQGDCRLEKAREDIERRAKEYRKFQSEYHQLQTKPLRTFHTRYLPHREPTTTNPTEYVSSGGQANLSNDA
jgi:hypothetical protein